MRKPEERSALQDKYGEALVSGNEKEAFIVCLIKKVV